MSLVIVHIVTFNSARTIQCCLDSVLAQEGFEHGRTLHIIVTDNASSDNTVELLERYHGRVNVRRNAENIGFTGAHNAEAARAMESGADAFFVLNPDVRLESDALAALFAALRIDPRAAMVSPKLYRAGADLEPVSPRCFDTTGMYITPELRHFDRGSNQLDTGQYDRAEYVFGVSGAAMLLRREFILDASFPPDVSGQPPMLFDSLFFAYREDAELSWRAQSLGWKCRYEPRAVGYHERQVLPDNRASLKPELNAYSVRNRFLMQITHLSAGLGFRIAAAGLWRNVLVVGGVRLRERSSLPALRSVRALLPVALRRRRWMLRHRRVRPYELSKWFAQSPHAEPALAGRSSPSAIRKVTAIIVNYNSAGRLVECVRSLSGPHSDLPLRICVVDNESSDNSLRLLREGVSSAAYTLLEQGRNSGFASALNAAADALPADAYLILNPDVRITAHEVARLSRALDENAELGVVSPVLKGIDGRPQWHYLLRGFPSLPSVLAELFFLHRLMPKNRFTARYQPTADRFRRRRILGLESGRLLPRESASRPVLTDQPAAACLLVRHAAWAAAAGFDEEFSPAWFEDVDFSKRLSMRGFLGAVEPRAFAVHEGGYSAKSLGRPTFYSIWYPNLVRYFRKHGTRSEYLVLRSLLPLALLLRSAGSYLNSFRSADASADRAVAKTLAALALRGGASAG